MNEARVWLVTGSPEAGKTTFCRLIAELAHQSNWDVAGLLSPAVIGEGQKTGIMVEDLSTGELRPLATITPKKGFDLPVGRWHFSRNSLAWGAEVISECLPCDLLILDELGPLELRQGGGWAAGMHTLKKPGFRLALVVVRATLLDLALNRLPGAEVLTLSDAQSLEATAQSWWKQQQHAPPPRQ